LNAFAKEYLVAFRSVEAGPSFERSLESQTGWHTAGMLLERGQYEQVAKLLGEARHTAERSGDTMLVGILAAAHHICLTCSRYRTEVESQRRTYEEALDGERELRQQLQAILELVGQQIEEEAQKPLALALLGETWPDRPENGRFASLGLRPHEQNRPVWREDSRLKGQAAQNHFALVVYCLGNFRVHQNERLILEWNGLKSQMILKYLVAHKGKPITKDILMDIFWPDVDPDAARRNLNQAIYSLRQTLRNSHSPIHYILFENDSYLLNPEVNVWLDWEEFEKHVGVGRRLEAAGHLASAMMEYGVAEGLYQGDFLQEDLYEEWSRSLREKLRSMYLDIADRLSGYYWQKGEYAAAIALCQKVLTHDSCHEEAHRRLMRCYLAQGQRHLAVRQYHICQERLMDELGLTPDDETKALYRQLMA
jgi:two-component SAPR family response regulator